MQIMRQFKTGHIAFTEGKFDKWAVVIKAPGIPEWPKDVWYFTKLWVYKQDLGEKVWDDFCALYDKTGPTVDESVFDWIHDISAEYPNQSESEIVFAILYMTMIAEENKQGAILKRRIKKLGVHQVLKEGMRPAIAAEYSKGKKVGTLVMECHSRGF
jgi:hypothetical protein